MAPVQGIAIIAHSTRTEVRCVTCGLHWDWAEPRVPRGPETNGKATPAVTPEEHKKADPEHEIYGSKATLFEYQAVERG